MGFWSYGGNHHIGSSPLRVKSSIPIPHTKWAQIPVISIGAENSSTYRASTSPSYHIHCGVIYKAYMGVSENRATPKWMVYNGKPY